jgi:4-amino-4-deoxy-L-arabinose transferase-like glycosyltransferase
MFQSADLILIAAEQIFLAGALATFLLAERRNAVTAGVVPRLPWWLPFACYLVLMTVVILFVTRHAIGVDESAILFQANTFHSGRLTVPAPPESEGLYHTEFQFVQHAMYRGKWFSQYPAGWPALIAMSMFLGADSILTPALGLLYLILVYKLAREVLGYDTAVYSVLTLAVAPAFLFLSSGFLTHIPCATFVLGAFYFAWRARQSKSVLPLIGAVVCLAGAAFIRQYTAALVGIVIVPMVLAAAWSSAKRIVTVLVTGAVCAALLMAWNFHYDEVLMGDPLRSPYSYNFPHLFNWSLSHILDRLINATRWSLQGTLVYVFVLMLPLSIFCLARERAQRCFVYLLAAVFASLVIGHIPFSLLSGEYFWRPISNSSFAVGERYYSEAYFGAAILTGRGLELVIEYFNASRRSVAVCMVVLCLAQCLHLGLFMHRARVRNEYAIALQRFVLATPSTNAVIFGPDYFGDINFNGWDWQHAPKFYMHDPTTESKRKALVRLLGRRNWVVVQYDDDRRVVTAQEFALPGS